jgi:hypothetical protein
MNQEQINALQELLGIIAGNSSEELRKWTLAKKAGVVTEEAYLAKLQELKSHATSIILPENN